MAKKIYKEKQRFGSVEMIAILILSMGLLIYSLFNSLMAHNGAFTYVEWSCVSLLLMLGGFLWYLLQLQLSLSISENGIQFKMKPLHNKKRMIAWEEIDSCEIVKTPKLAQWHGGNITFNHEKRFSLTGRNGIHLVTKDGEEYFLGSRKLSELRKAIEKVAND